jgi:deoxyadenosine/deoxycytidine kinase
MPCMEYYLHTVENYALHYENFRLYKRYGRQQNMWNLISTFEVSNKI